MTKDMPRTQKLQTVPSVERLTEFAPGDLNDLCDATLAAIEGGGGFGWVRKPERDVLERFWRGVVAMPARALFVARLDNMICGTCQLIKPPANNEAQGHAAHLTTNFVAPWARGHGLAKMLLEAVEKHAREEGFVVINLDVRETMDRAIALYEAAGYTRFGEHPHYARIDGTMIRGFYYSKWIGETPAV